MRSLYCVVIQHKQSTTVVCNDSRDLKSHEVEGEYDTEVGAVGKQVFSFIIETPFGSDIEERDVHSSNAPVPIDATFADMTILCSWKHLRNA